MKRWATMGDMDVHYTERALKRLKDKGYRITLPRRRVVELLDKAEKPLTPFEIKDHLADAGEPVDLVSIYRILECLDQNGLLHRIWSSGRVLKCDLDEEHGCERQQHDHCHHSLVCRGCGRVEEVHCPDIAPLQAEIARESGYLIESHYLEFSGLCKQCR